MSDLQIPPDSASSVVEFGKAVAPSVTQLVLALGSWADRKFGPTITDLVGVAGGQLLHHIFTMNEIRFAEKAAKRLEEVDAARRTPPSLSVVAPIVEAAREESREVLQDLWAALLANAMLDGGKKVRRQFVDVLRKMDPADAVLLLLASQPAEWTAPGVNTTGHTMDGFRAGAEVKGYAALDVDVSMRVLKDLGCLVDNAPGSPPYLLAFGRGLLAACKVE